MIFVGKYSLTSSPNSDPYNNPPMSFSENCFQFQLRIKYDPQDVNRFILFYLASSKLEFVYIYFNVDDFCSKL